MQGERQHWLREGTLLDGRYEIRRVIGQGGFGITYEGVNTRIRLRVAVKELYIGECMRRDCEKSCEVQVEEEYQAFFAAQREKFLREAQILSEFAQEEGVVRVTDYFEGNGTAYLVMEYLEGETLQEWIRENGRMPAEEAFRRILPVVRTLGKIHRRGIIHRDISPDNLMVLTDGSLRLMDFGAARDYGEEAKRGLSMILKDGYAPIEQYRTGTAQGPWTDVYSLCASMYACVAGTAPEMSAARALRDGLRPPSALGADITGEEEAVLLKGLAVEPSGRFQAMEELEEAMEHSLSLREQEREEEGFRKARGSAQGRGRSFLWLAACVAGLAAVLLLSRWLLRRGTAEYQMSHMPVYEAVLVPATGLTPREYYDIERILEERLAQTAGENQYLLSQGKGVFALTIPEERFPSAQIPYYGEAYLWGMSEWYLYPCKEEETGLAGAVGLESGGEDYVIDFAPYMVEEAQVVGEIPAAAKGQGNAEAGQEEANYLKITLVPEYADTILEALPENALLCMELMTGYLYDGADMFSYGSLSAVPEEGCLYLRDNVGDRALLETLADNLSHEGIPGVLELYAQPRTVWEDPSQAQQPGEFQCGEEEIEGAAAVVTYVAMWPEEMEDEIGLDSAVIDLKRRLDSLQIPYAFGYGEQEPSDLAVKTALEDMSLFWASALQEDSSFFGVGNQWGKRWGLNDGTIWESVQVSEDGGGTVGSLTLQCAADALEDWQEFLEEMGEYGEDTLYLWAGQGRLAACPVTEECQEGTVVFGELLLAQDGGEAGQLSRVYGYILACSWETDFNDYMLSQAVVLDKEGRPDYWTQLPQGGEWEWLAKPDFEGYREAVRAVDPQASVEASYGADSNSVDIHLGEAASLDSVGEMLENIRRIYEACGFDNGEVDYVDFSCDTEEGGTGAISLSFNKRAYDRRMETWVLVLGEASEQYEEQLEALMQEDPFWQAHAQPELEEYDFQVVS